VALLVATLGGGVRSPCGDGQEITFVPLYTIGQTPVRKSDKQRHAFRTEADTEGLRSGLSFWQDGAIMIVKWLFGMLTGGVLLTLATNSFEAEVAGPLGPVFTPIMLISLGLCLAGLGLWGRKKIFQGTPVVDRTPASGGKEGKHE